MTKKPKPIVIAVDVDVTLNGRITWSVPINIRQTLQVTQGRAYDPVQKRWIHKVVAEVVPRKRATP